MLDRQLGLQDGCRQLVALRHELASSDSADPDLLFVVGIDSDLEEFPLGPVRDRWAPGALAEVDRRRDERLERVREPLLAACRALAAWT